MKVISFISGKLMLIFYIAGLYRLWHLCQYGGVQRHVPMLSGCAAGFFVCLILWLISRRYRKENTPGKLAKGLFLAEMVVFVGATVWFGVKVAEAATPYNGALSWKVDEWKRKRMVTLEHTNFYEDGAEGILKDLDEALGLPDTLYVASSFSLTFDGEGEILTVYAFLYGADTDGEERTYLISYDAGESEKMTVWLDGNASGDYGEEKLLDPMFTILESVDWQEQAANWSLSSPESEGQAVYKISYSGSKSFTSATDLYRVTGEGIETDSYLFSLLNAGGQIDGYTVTFSASDGISPLYFILDPEYTSQIQLNAERESGEIAEAIEAEGWYTDSADGTMYYFLDENEGWRLVVVDAAAGSRAYALYHTENSGITWVEVNADPCLGYAGLAEGLIFYNEDWGIVGLGSASGSFSRMFITWDGGETFALIEIDRSTVTALPETADEYGYTVEDYDYFCMPEENDGVLTMLITSDQTEQEGIVFSSTDEGKTWTFVGAE